MRTIRKIICILCALAMITVAFSSCLLQEENGEKIELSKDTLAEYVFVYGSDASAELKAKVGELSLKFKEKFGVLISSQDDAKKESVNTLATKETEILIGVTNREESKSFLDGFKNKDYGWKAINKKLVIAGVNDEMTITAIDAFITNVLSTEPAEGAFYTSKSDYTYTGKYQLDTITIGGRDIREYSVVYDDDAYAMQYIAELIRDSIADKCGYYLSVVEAKKATGLKITVGKTNAADGTMACELASDGNITVGGSTSQAIYETATALARKIGGLSASALDVSVSGTFSENELTVMTWNVYQGVKEVSAQRAAAYKSVIDELNPDILMIQEMPLNYSDERFGAALNSNYVKATVKREDIALPAYPTQIIYYNKNTVKLLSSHYFYTSETPDVPSAFSGANVQSTLVYSEFEQISSGNKVLAASAHLGIESSGMRVKQMGVIDEFFSKYRAENPETAIVFGGDLNCEPMDKVISSIKKAGYANSSEVADVVNAANTFPSKEHVIDYLFVNNGGALVSSYTVKDLGLHTKDYVNGNPSDHNPVVIKISLTPQLAR